LGPIPGVKGGPTGKKKGKVLDSSILGGRKLGLGRKVRKVEKFDRSRVGRLWGRRKKSRIKKKWRSKNKISCSKRREVAAREGFDGIRGTKNRVDKL